MAIEWVTHKGKRLLYIDYNGLSPAQQLDQIRQATKVLLDTKSDQNLTLTDIRNMAVTQEFMDLAKEMGKESGKATKKAAVVGVEGIRKVLLKAVNNFSGNPRRPFDTVEEAKDWLVE